MTDKELDIINRLITGVREMDEDLAVNAAYEALKYNIDPLTAINDGLVAGMNQAGLLYEQEEYFVPELLLCSDALYAGLDILSPHLEQASEGSKVRVVIGVVEGDTHDIGKNLVKLMLEVAGFEVHDLGRDVPLHDFVDKVKELNAGLVSMSTLMSTTMEGMGRVINLLEQEGLRQSVRVMVGGSPLSKAFADSIGADGYSSNATGAVRLARQLTMPPAQAV